jgi:predicted SAM-dependent methyltransferase
MSWLTACKYLKARDAIQVMNSGYFDRRFYEMNNPDIPHGPLASLRHFLVQGGKEGRSPSRKFDSQFYLYQYPDVKNAGVNPLVHFLRYGRAEKRFPTRYALLVENEKFTSQDELLVFVELLRKSKESAGATCADVDLQDIFGCQQPERRAVRRLIASMFISGCGIEVGALQDPLPVPADATVKYVDRFSKPDLYIQYPELLGAPLVEVDFVDNGEQLFTLPSQSQDFVIANHFLEHTQDPIATLKNFCRVVRPGGYLYIAVPDQTSTFDKDREPTTLQHVVEDHRNGPAGSRHQHFHEWVTLCEPHFGRNYSPDQVKERVRELEEKDYSIHYHCWRPQDFAEFLRYCSDEENIGFKVALFCRCPGEMVVLLRRV